MSGIRIMEQMGHHDGGTKYYRVITAFASDNTGFVIIQYGPNGKLGNVNGQSYVSGHETELTGARQVRVKSGRGYKFELSAPAPGGPASDDLIERAGRICPAFHAWRMSKTPGVVPSSGPPWSPTPRSPPASVVVKPAAPEKPEPKREDTDPHWGTW